MKKSLKGFARCNKSRAPGRKTTHLSQGSAKIIVGQKNARTQETNAKHQKWIRSEEMFYKSHILNSLPVRNDVTMEIWKKKLPECFSVWQAPFGLFIFYFLMQHFCVKRLCCKVSGCIVVCVNGHTAAPVWYKPSCQYSFSTATVWMMRFSSLRNLAWKVHRSPFCSQKMSSPLILCSHSGTNCWLEIKYCTVKKQELWHLCCHIVHLRPCCAPGPILLWNWTKWCLEMHPADVLKHTEPFVSIFQDIYKTFISSENRFLSSPMLLTHRVLCCVDRRRVCKKYIYKVKDHLYLFMYGLFKGIHTTKLCLF